MNTTKEIILLRLAELMLLQEKNYIAIDELYNDNIIGVYVKNIQIDSPFQELLFEGVISQYLSENEIIITFTVEAYFHLVLARLITSQKKYRKDSDLNFLLLNSKLKGIAATIKIILSEDIIYNNYSRLTYFIDEGGKSLEVSIQALGTAFLLYPIESVIQELMANPSISDWLAIKKSYDYLSENNKVEVINKINHYLLNEPVLEQFLESQLKNKDTQFASLIEIVSLYKSANALDKAKDCYEKIIKLLEQNSQTNIVNLCNALETYGESEYNRSGQDGYKRAMDSLTKALNYRIDNGLGQPLVLANTHKLLGLAYLSLGLQVRESKVHLEKSLNYYQQVYIASDPICLEIERIIGIVTFWWGLKAIGRWGNAETKLLEGIEGDLFDNAAKHFENVYNHFIKSFGKQHKKTFETCHYLQEIYYTIGNYEKAIPWLKLIQTDNFYKYGLIVCLEELGINSSQNNKSIANEYFEEALKYANLYSKTSNEIQERISSEIMLIKDNKSIVSQSFIQIKDMPDLDFYENITATWEQIVFPIEWKNLQSNSYLIDESKNILYLFSQVEKTLIIYNYIENTADSIVLNDWPAKATILALDNSKSRILAWPSIKDDLYALDLITKKWTKIFTGIHDVHGCGSAFGFNPISNGVFHFGGYGYFKYKNWWWDWNETSLSWNETIVNQPGVSPYPRNTQIIPALEKNKLFLFSGIGSDTGLQREHKARKGLASATDVGYFTWLRDLWEIDLETMNWKNILPYNDESIRHEGTIGLLSKKKLLFNWGGIIPSPIFGEPNIEVDKLSVLDFKNKEIKFKNCKYNGDIPPLNGGKFIDFGDTNSILYINECGIWKLSIKEKYLFNSSH